MQLSVSWAISPALVVAVIFGSVSAHAQPGPGAGATAPQARPQSEPSAGGPAEASVRFQRGTKFYSEGDFKLAIIEFQRAYELAPNYRVLYNVGQVNLQLNNYAAALRAYEQYLAEGGDQISAERRAAAETEIAGLRARTARVTVRSPTSNARVAIDEIDVGPAPVESYLLDAGQQHVIRVTAPGHEARTQSLMLAGAEGRTLDMTLAPIEDRVVVRSNTPQVISFVTGGTLGAAAIITGVLALNALRDLRDLRESSSFVESSALGDAQSRARHLAIATDVLGATAIAAGLAGLYFTLRPSNPPATKVGLRAIEALSPAGTTF